MQETPIIVLILIETYTVIKGIFDFQKVNLENLQIFKITVYENQSTFNFVEIFATKSGCM